MRKLSMNPIEALHTLADDFQSLAFMAPTDKSDGPKCGHGCERLRDILYSHQDAVLWAREYESHNHLIPTPDDNPLIRIEKLRGEILSIQPTGPNAKLIGECLTRINDKLDVLFLALKQHTVGPRWLDELVDYQRAEHQRAKAELLHPQFTGGAA